MAEDAATELAKNITRNIVPFNAGEDIYAVGKAAEGGRNVVKQLLMKLGLIPQPNPNDFGASGPLPRIDPKSGQIIWPEGSPQRQAEAPITPGDALARREQGLLNQRLGR